jgi:hypothetical protein
MIAYEGKSPIEVARFFNENNVGSRKMWADENVRKLYHRERLLGIEVFRKTRQIRDRRTGKIRTEKINRENWLRRESPHLRILTDELADAVKRRLDRGASSFGRAATDESKRKQRVDVYPRVLIRPVCGGCGEPMCLGRSAGKYQSFFCTSALYGIHGCQNRGYKSARLIDEADHALLGGTGLRPLEAVAEGVLGQGGVAAHEPVVERDPPRRRAHEGAVAAAEVLDPHPVGTEDHPDVAGRHARLPKHEVVAGGAADEHDPGGAGSRPGLRCVLGHRHPVDRPRGAVRSVLFPGYVAATKPSKTGPPGGPFPRTATAARCGPSAR